MKVVCIDNTRGNARHLEVGQIYDAVATPIERFKKEYLVVIARPWLVPFVKGKRLNEKKDLWVEADCFISLQEWRQRQLDKLLL
jgi:hypothetical protein